MINDVVDLIRRGYLMVLNRLVRHVSLDYLGGTLGGNPKGVIGMSIVLYSLFETSNKDQLMSTVNVTFCGVFN